MACKPPTCQQLAYLDELKERLQELRKRQETFMEETAEMLRSISTNSQSTLASAVPSTISLKLIMPDEDDVEVCSVGIKQLIQRFEDLRQTSRQFGEQPLPEELAGVDVRKLLKGYEKLIVEGNRLQQSWLLLKKTTENCALHGKRDERMFMNNKLSSKSSSFAEQQKTPEDALSPKTDIETDMELAQQKAFKDRTSCGKKGNKGKRHGFGAFLQLGLFMNPFKRCAKRSTKPSQDEL